MLKMPKLGVLLVDCGLELNVQVHITIDEQVNNTFRERAILNAMLMLDLRNQTLDEGRRLDHAVHDVIAQLPTNNGLSLLMDDSSNHE